MKYFTFLLLLLLINTSCSQKQLAAADYLNWIEDPSNGLKRETQIGDDQIAVQYRPTDYMLLKSLDMQDYTVQVVDSIRTQCDSLAYFLITIKNKRDILKSASIQEREERMYYFQFQFLNDLYIEKGTEKIKPELFHFERMNTINNARVFLVAFDRTKLPAGEWVFMIDSPFLNSTGVVKFRFDEDTRNNIPTVSI